MMMMTTTMTTEKVSLVWNNNSYKKKKKQYSLPSSPSLSPFSFAQIRFRYNSSAHRQKDLPVFKPNPIKQSFQICIPGVPAGRKGRREWKAKRT